MNRLEADTAASLLAGMPDWSHDRQRDAITREFEFEDFIQAFSFMTQLAIHAEKHNHHPEWSNVYNRVVITLTTHDANGLTQSDIDFARYADAAFMRFSRA
jgi:4a-hydroxytetrahydrobiopterin dehydratase